MKDAEIEVSAAEPATPKSPTEELSAIATRIIEGIYVRASHAYQNTPPYFQLSDEQRADILAPFEAPLHVDMAVFGELLLRAYDMGRQTVLTSLHKSHVSRVEAHELLDQVVTGQVPDIMHDAFGMVYPGRS